MPIPTRCTLGPRLVATIVLATPLLATPPQAPQGGLAARYEQQLTEVRAELERAMPKVRAKQRQAFLEARDAEKAAVAALAAAQQELGKVGTAKALVGHAKGKWIGGADKGIAKAKQQLAKATDASARAAAQGELTKWQENRAEGVAALKERQGNLDRALREQPKMERAVKTAKAKLRRAEKAVAQSLTRLGLNAKLASSKLDKRLAKFVVLKEATPGGLAAFAQQGSAQQQLVDRLLADPSLMLQMVISLFEHRALSGTSQAPQSVR